jgi:transposase-like protein
VGDAYHEGMEDQLGALALVLNCITLWNTVYLDAALARLHAEGYPVRDKDAVRLSPYMRRHLNVYGHYSFQPPDFAGARRDAARPRRQRMRRRPIVEVAREHGLGETTLGNWMKKYRHTHAGEEPPLELSERAELQELRRRVREQEMELAFLKKATAYFAREQR